MLHFAIHNKSPKSVFRTLDKNIYDMEKMDLTNHLN